MHSLLEFNFRAIALMCNDASTLKEIIYTEDYERQRQLVLRSQFYYLDTVLKYATREYADWGHAMNQVRTMEPIFSSLHLLAQDLLKPWRRCTEDGWFLEWDEKLHEIFTVPLPGQLSAYCHIPELPRLILSLDNGVAKELASNFSRANFKVKFHSASSAPTKLLAQDVLPYALAYLSVFYMTNDRG